MQVSDVFANGVRFLRILGEVGYRFELGVPIIVKNKSTQEEVRITEIEADKPGNEVINLYVGRETEALNPDDFEIVGPAPENE